MRNRADGSVEAVIQGEDGRVADMAARCERGPAGAAVTRVEVVGAVDETFSGFEVRPTA